MSVSTTPIVMNPSCTNTTGIASATVARNSECCALPLVNMPANIRFPLVVIVAVTVATLAAPRDVRAQEVSLGAQAIPVVTRADPTAGARTITEGYVTQPIVMAHASWTGWRAIATLNVEGLTIE